VDGVVVGLERERGVLGGAGDLAELVGGNSPTSRSVALSRSPEGSALEAVSFRHFRTGVGVRLATMPPAVLTASTSAARSQMTFMAIPSLN
jgi:hypothetical protein